MDAVTQVPSPYNEPIRQYQPGSADRSAVAARIKDLASQRADLTMTVGGRQLMGSGERVPVVQPHNHQHVLGWFGNATDADVEAAIAAAGAAAKGWRALSFEDRAAVFLRAADLLAGPWRATLNAATILGQSKSVFQAEIDAACELIDFWRYNVAFARQFETVKPYPYHASGGDLGDELFTRRASIYFGIAHLLDYQAPYDRYLYRFADYNAGQYASRNAAFQQAASIVAGKPLTADGALLAHDPRAKGAGSTQRLLLAIAGRLDLSDADIQAALEQGTAASFGKSALYRRIFELAEVLLNAANEVAVQAFLDDRISFTEIWRLVQNAMGCHSNLASPTLDDILRADKEARDFVQRALL